MMADVAFYMTFSSIIFCVLNTVAPELLDYLMGGNFAIMGPVMWLVLGTPAQIFVLVAQMEAYRGRRAVSELVRFTLADAQCHSDSDRAELQQLIAKWFTESHEGGEDARRLGFHRFEQFVRHTLAPTLLCGRRSYPKVLLAGSIIGTAPTFDILCSDAATEYHLLSLVAMCVLMVSLTLPFYLLVYEQSARLVLVLREQRRWPAVAAYAVGVLLNNVALVGFVLAFVLAGPTQVFDPDYRLPQEGVLDATGRKILKSNVAVIFTGVGALAVAGTFKL